MEDIVSKDCQLAVQRGATYVGKPVCSPCWCLWPGAVTVFLAPPSIILLIRLAGCTTECAKPPAPKASAPL